MDYVIRKCAMAEVQSLCERFHGYGGAGDIGTYCFGVYEGRSIVAGYAWQPPPPGSAESVCAAAPQGVLSLSRMVAVPRAERRLNHVSRPLRHQMHRLIDRTRWPVLVTYSDEGQGHTGHVYKCSGWKPTTKSARRFFIDSDGVRVSSYKDGRTDTSGISAGGTTTIQRWEHWICDDPAGWMSQHGWNRVAVRGKRWKSGAQAYRWERATEQVNMFDAVR